MWFLCLFKTRLNIWKFTVHILLKPGLENFEHYLVTMWDECKCVVVGSFFSIALLWDWNENWPFPVLWPLLSFPSWLAYWVQHFHSVIFQDLKQPNWNAITSTSFVHSNASKGPLDFTFQDVWFLGSYWRWELRDDAQILLLQKFRINRKEDNPCRNPLTPLNFEEEILDSWTRHDQYGAPV